MQKLSINKFIVEPYRGDRALRANTTSGFAMIEQRTAVKPFKTLVNATISLGNYMENVPAGSILYIKEELLFQPGWAQKIYTSEDIEGGFMVVDPVHVEFISLAEPTAPDYY